MRHGLEFNGYWPGAIKTQAELQDLITEARREKKAIRLYEVSQGGHFSELFITSKSRIENAWEPYGDDVPAKKFNYIRKPSWHSKEKFYRSYGCLCDLNVMQTDGRRGGYNRHQLFSNRALALAYSEHLKADARYQQSIKSWHAQCDRMFSLV